MIIYAASRERPVGYNIDRIIGKDLWVKVNIIRERSYDRWSYSSKYPGLDGIGWIQVVSSTPAYYTFHWLKDEYHRQLFSVREISRASSEQYTLKKNSTQLIQPVEYRSTEDLEKSPYR